MDKSSTDRNNGRGKDAAFAGWQVTLCDPMCDIQALVAVWVLLALTATRFLFTSLPLQTHTLSATEAIDHPTHALDTAGVGNWAHSMGP